MYKNIAFYFLDYETNIECNAIEMTFNVERKRIFLLKLSDLKVYMTDTKSFTTKNSKHFNSIII